MCLCAQCHYFAGSPSLSSMLAKREMWEIRGLASPTLMPEQIQDRERAQCSIYLLFVLLLHSVHKDPLPVPLQQSCRSQCEHSDLDFIAALNNVGLRTVWTSVNPGGNNMTGWQPWGSRLYCRCSSPVAMCLQRRYVDSWDLVIVV